MDGRDIEKEAPLFCNILGQDFECSEAEGKALLENLMDKEYDLDHHIQIIKIALCEDKISKYHLDKLQGPLPYGVDYAFLSP